jgi:Grx4 family monothiol glutaredoxin
VDTLDGADVPLLVEKVGKLAGGAVTNSSAALPKAPIPAKQDITTRIKALLGGSDVLLFMKGNPEAPRCGFSRRVVEAIKATGTKFSTFDILEDEEVRQGLKEYSDWPTYPQLYVKGELLGGCDIIEEMSGDGSLKAALVEATPAKAETVEERIKALLGGSDVLLFMKGNPEAPRCGFSRRVVEAINATGTKFSTFDILEDEEVRQGLKEYSDWPTYPQLYVKGELLGGCDIIEEMSGDGSLKAALAG